MCTAAYAAMCAAAYAAMCPAAYAVCAVSYSLHLHWRQNKEYKNVTEIEIGKTSYDIQQKLS